VTLNYLTTNVSGVAAREVALDMWIVAILLLASLTPVLSVKIIETQYPRVHSFLLLGLLQ